jgi:hypothetical protein
LKMKRLSIWWHYSILVWSANKNNSGERGSYGIHDRIEKRFQDFRSLCLKEVDDDFL